ncbi:Lipopolysaccharide export system ATP-binding protein LptB [Neomoorella glycerini]|uniref:Lipopolysaccharide export system ATP-binding protein LptB n=1 Tax=Neomoorella glycerini TaxID=55779 RepID=A0A6I5ZQX3_9FIRM|nr:ABC transporter ATP-binding protein [Moorella glycerini]QGP92049.1 Lipopolysaccharide export system ATP-binding protein LptB [Moorella glycerini]
MLQICNLNKNFGGVKAVQNFNMEVEKGSITGIIGPNGAGKTTILNLISGIYKADAGQIFFNNRDISNMRQHQIVRLGISRTFQNIRLFKGLNCLDNVKAARDYCTPYNLLEALLQLPRVARAERELERVARECLELVNLSHYAPEKPENLPYGLQRRLEIARALVNKPRLLLLDEPAAGLNPEEVSDLIQLIKKIYHDLQLTIIIIEHKMEVIMNLCQKIYVQNFGQTIAVGTPGEIQTNKEVLQAYLGEEA